MFDVEKKHFIVDRIIFYNKESQWGVLATTPVEDLPEKQQCLFNKYGNVSITGNFIGVYEDAEVEVSGDIVESKYGKAIQVRSLQVIQDNKSKEGVVNFLAKSLIRGISVQNAKKIYEVYKDKSIDTVLTNPEKLISINGIGQKTVDKVTESVGQYLRMRPLIDYCSNLGLHYSLINKLDEELGEDALATIMTDPYKVLELTNNISFKQIDEIFLKGGGSPTATVRLETGLLWVLKNLAMLEGSTGCKSSSLKSKFYTTLNLTGENNEYESTAFNLSTAGKLVLSEGAITGMETGYVYYKPYVDIEKSIAEKIQALNKYGLLGDKIREDVVDEEIHNFPFELNEQQKKAVHECLQHNVSVLTGPAGCVDGDTEYFNGEEWVPIRDFKDGDKVLQYNQDGTAELVSPIKYIKGKADLWHIHNISGNIDQVLSDNHRFIYLSTKDNLNEKPFGEVRKILSEKGSFSAFLINSFKINYEIPTSLTPARLRLMIAISADGSLVKSGNYWRVRLKKERKKVRMRELLALNKLEVKENVYADGYSNFNIPVEYGCKEFPSYFYFLPKELKEVFNEEIFLWDGSLKNGNRNVKMYFSTIKKNADIVQFILSQNGYMVNITIDDRLGEFHSSGDYLYKSVNYYVRQTKWKKVSLQRGTRELKERKKGIKIEKFIPSDGCQYCFEVPSSMLVLRRNNKIFITGNSGKSSITKALSRVYRRCGFRVNHLSPTAKACRRLEECVGTSDAQTIHKFLGMKKDTDFSPKKAYAQDSVLIIDEASMLDIILFNYLLVGTNLTSRVLLIGDNNQLPSVQAGNVLGDLIDSKQVHVSQLTDVMRQKEDSKIIDFCSQINNGEVFDPCEFPDFHYEEFGEGQELRDFFYKKYVEEVKENGLNEVQVITPYKKGELGMDNLNKFIQENYNAEGKLTIEPYKMGDKVRHTQNNYKKDVYNGETGTIITYDSDLEELMVDYGNKTIWYNKEDIAEVTLSYVSTVHASQGSEYKVVFVILDDTSVNDFLLIRRLLYTAVSRGKKKVYVLSKPYLVDKCIQNNSYRPRITKLKEFLKNEE